MQIAFWRRHTRLSIFLMVMVATVGTSIVLQGVELDTPRAPLGKGVEAIMDWAIVTLSPALEAIKLVLSRIFTAIEWLFLTIPWPVWIMLIGLLGWLLVSVLTGLLIAGSIFIIQLLDLWNEAMSTLALVSTAMILTVIIAIPVGIIAAKNERFNVILRPILDAMQTIPALVYLIPAIMLLVVGKVPAIAATLIFSIPPAIRLTSLGIRQVPIEVKEAALAFGSTRWQLLIEAEIPLALRTIMAGINQSTMMSVSMVVIAAFIGAGGLGYSVLFALDRVRVGAGFEAGLAILIIAIVLDRLTQALARTK